MLFSLWLTCRVGWLVQVFALVGVLGSLWECDVTASNQGNSQWPIRCRQPCEWMGCDWEAWQHLEVQNVLQTLRKEIIAAFHEQLTPQELESEWQVCVYSSLPVAAHPSQYRLDLGNDFRDQYLASTTYYWPTFMVPMDYACLLGPAFHWVASRSALEGPVAFQ
jgi:hypothetical protein